MKKKYWKHKKYPGKKFEGNYVSIINWPNSCYFDLCSTTGRVNRKYRSHAAKKAGWRLS